MKRRNRIVASIAAAGVLACGAVAAVAVLSSTGKPASSHRASLAVSSGCTGPVGAAYVADPGYQGFTAVDTSDCYVVQTYNVDDLQVTGDTGDYNYDGSDQGIALHGTTLWFAVTGTDNVASIDTTTLDPSNYNPAESVIPVGLMPQQLAVTPDGSEVWVADAGPQTLTTPLWGVAIIPTSTGTVTGHLWLRGDPTDVAFSPSGDEAYVTASDGLYVYDVASQRQVAFVRGLGSPQSVVVAPGGASVYVTEAAAGQLATISAATNTVERTTSVGGEPWRAAVSPDGSTVYVANTDSDSVSAIDATTGKVSNTITVPGNPDTLAVTPDGSELWVTGLDSGIVYVIDTATDAVTGQTNLGGDGPQSGDGLGPSGIVLTIAPTPEGSAMASHG